MDYTRIPRELIYKNRTEIDDYPINEDHPDSLESLFYKKIIKYPFIKNAWQGPDYVLKIFNNAYYICTLILLEKNPTLYQARYKIIASENSQEFNMRFNVMPATMALVYNLLEYYVKKDAEEDIMKEICNGFHNWEDPNDYNEWMEKFDDLLIKSFECSSFIPSFEPRNIYDVITDEDIDRQKLTKGIKYILERITKSDQATTCLPILYNRLSTSKSTSEETKAIKQTTIALQNIGITLPPIITQEEELKNDSVLEQDQIRINHAEAQDGNEELNNVKRLEIDERIIFFSIALGVNLAGENINQKQLATLISKLTGDETESIRTRISALNKEEEKKFRGENEDFSPKTKEAASNVYKYVAAVAKYESRIKVWTKQILENINDTYNLNIS